MKRAGLALIVVFSLVRYRSHMGERLTRAMCWWAGHEPKPLTFKTATIEYGTCKHCGIEIITRLDTDTSVAA